jgi:hypothetical protein
MTILSVTALFVVQTAAEFLEAGLGLAESLGLPVTSWRSGDPTKSLYHYMAEKLATLDTVQATHIKNSWLSSAVTDANESGTSEWLKILAYEVYGVTATEATYATPTCTLTNTGGGFYVVDVGDLTYRASGIDKTYHNTTGGTLSAGVTLAFDLVADEAGSDSTVGVDEVDELVTTLLGVEVVSSTAAVANDEQAPDAIAEQCRATLGALSPDGPPDAYEYVVRNADLTGVTDITKAKATGDSTTGIVTVYVAGPSGPVAGASVTAAQAAIDIWATPLCITATVANATGVTLNVTATVSGEDIPDDADDLCTTALEALFATFDIAETVPTSAIVATIHNTMIAAGATDVVVTLTLPAANTTMTASQVAALGTVTVTEV